MIADTSVILLNNELLNTLTELAQSAPRKRQNHNLHKHSDEPAQRFLNALEPDSYVVPHRHSLAGKEETLILLRGRLGLVLFHQNGTIARTLVMSASDSLLGCQIPIGIWHCVVALESGTVIFEVKNGPYVETNSQEYAPWAPSEGSPEVQSWLQQMRNLFRP